MSTLGTVSPGGRPFCRVRYRAAVECAMLMRGLGRDAAADALGVDQPHADQGAGDGLERLQQVGLGLAGDVEPVDEQAEEERADERTDERADDAAPEAIREPDREVPEGEAH